MDTSPFTMSGKRMVLTASTCGFAIGVNHCHPVNLWSHSSGGPQSHFAHKGDYRMRIASIVIALLVIAPVAAASSDMQIDVSLSPADTLPGLPVALRLVVTNAAHRNAT